MKLVKQTDLLHSLFWDGISPYVLKVTDIVRGFRFGCRFYRHSCDVLFRVFRGISRDVVRLLIDVRQHTQSMSCWDDPEIVYTYIHPPSSCRPSNGMRFCQFGVLPLLRSLLSRLRNALFLSALLPVSPDVSSALHLTWNEYNIKEGLCQVSN